MPNPILVGNIKWTRNADAYVVYKPSSQSLFNSQAVSLGDRDIKVVHSGFTVKKLRTVEQNNYYWGIVLQIIAEYCGYIGPGDKEQLHNEFRSIFLVRMGRMGQPYVESTTNLDTKLFEKYLEAVRKFAFDRYGIVVPLPNEVEIPEDSADYRLL